MKEAAEHLPFQLPNEFTRVGFLLAGITSSDAGDRQEAPFELAANFLQPFCPVLRKFPSGTKGDAIKISDVSGSDFGTKPSAGKTGVSLQYHTSKEYEVLTQPQKDEL
eukprot:7580259-Ditylum_brightwellii.AAC.1